MKETSALSLSGLKEACSDMLQFPRHAIHDLQALVTNYSRLSQPSPPPDLAAPPFEYAAGAFEAANNESCLFCAWICAIVNFCPPAPAPPAPPLIEPDFEGAEPKSPNRSEKSDAGFLAA